MQKFTFWIARFQIPRILALSLSYVISLLIFQHGLLIKRQVLPQKSSCSDAGVVNSGNCWLSPRYNKTIMLVIDALRYDFIYPYENDDKKMKGDQCNWNNQQSSSYFHGQMPNVARILREQPKHSMLFPFIADAPTTTFQRIKALVTGSVPAFIEAGDNFGGIEIGEDNLVDQLVGRGRNVTLLGDETWMQLLPGRFHRHFEEPSFDIKDLDTVDNTVIGHIFEELLQPNWSLLIAHCLGVDHAGHRYGPAHPEMRRKLRQMDNLILRLTKTMPDDAILFVLGDHGMTLTGDHGGDSFEELVSALFVYTKKKEGFSAERNEMMDEQQQTCQTKTNKKRTFLQVDLVPTLALLLDLPIPFSNIGSLIDPIFPGDKADLAPEIRLNYFQLLRYAQEYVRQKPELRDQLHKIVRQHESSPDDFDSNWHSISAIRSMIRDSLERQFQWTLCFLGLLSFFDALIFNCFLLVTGQDELRSPVLWIFRSALLLLQLSLIFAQQPDTDQILFSLACLAISLCYQLLVLIAKVLFLWRHHFQPTLICVLIAQFCLSTLPFSNSFIIYESDMLRYVTQTLVLLTAARLVRLYRITSIRNMPKDLADLLEYALAILICLRIFKLFESCREEQVECVIYKHSDSQLYILCISMSLANAYLLTEKFWTTFLGTKIFVWLMTILLWFQWLFEFSAHSMQGRQSELDEKLYEELTSANFTVSRLEYLSRSLAQFIFAFFIWHIILVQWLYSILLPNKGLINRFSWIESQYQVLSIPLMMLVGPNHAWIMGIILAIFPMAEQLFRFEKIWTWTWFLHLLGGYIFYAIGNQATLSSIPWRAAFVALPGNFPHKWLPALFILVSMFAGRLITALMVQRRDRRVGDEQAPLYFLLFGALKVFGCSAASLLHHRHLMFYKVFAPKFVFEGVEFLCTMAFIFVWICLLKITKIFQPSHPQSSSTFQ